MFYGHCRNHVAIIAFCLDGILITGVSCMLPLLRFVWMAYLLLEMTIGITRLKKNLNKEFKAKRV
jgi:hypothetical protein